MLFLIAYLLYNDAIQTVLSLASQFGNDELKIPVSTQPPSTKAVQVPSMPCAVALSSSTLAVVLRPLLQTYDAFDIW